MKDTIKKSINIMVLAFLVAILAGCSQQQAPQGQQAMNNEMMVPELPPPPVMPLPESMMAEADDISEEEEGMAATEPGSMMPSLVEIGMTAKRFEFEPATITVNQGDTVIINAMSIDVAHGFALPEFGINERLEPGNEVEIRFVADKKGTFTFYCSVACGSGHRSMTGTLIVK